MRVGDIANRRVDYDVKGSYLGEFDVKAYLWDSGIREQGKFVIDINEGREIM